MKKTFKQWVKQDKDLDDFLSPGDYIDERLYNYIGEIIPPAYYSRDFIQGCDAIKMKAMYYSTLQHTEPLIIGTYISVFYRNLNNNSKQINYEQNHLFYPRRKDTKWAVAYPERSEVSTSNKSNSPAAATQKHSASPVPSMPNAQHTPYRKEAAHDYPS